MLAVACLVTYWLATHLLSRVHSVGRDDDLLGGMWWEQPILRLADTIVGVAVGAVAAWAGLQVKWCVGTGRAVGCRRAEPESGGPGPGGRARDE